MGAGNTQKIGDRFFDRKNKLTVISREFINEDIIKFSNMVYAANLTSEL
ncbi:hypothetical protein [Dapis sp. BLCC M229]